MTSEHRLRSIDALRGFDMLLIYGAAAFLVQLRGVTGLAWVDAVADQLVHPEWIGFTFYDVVFPLFLFIVGVVQPFSLAANLQRGAGRWAIYRRAGRRMLVLIVLGIVYGNAPIPVFEPEQIRLGSVLGRIGIAGMVSTVLYCHWGMCRRLVAVGLVLVGYWIAMTMIPVPGFGAGDLTVEGNLAGWVDRSLLPGRLLLGSHDELGLLTTLPAVCLTVLGTVAGDLLRADISPIRKLQQLFFCGLGGVVLGIGWGLVFPISKQLWTSSFILLTAGISALFLALFYGVIDVLGWRRWAFCLEVVGMNSLAIYLGYRFINFEYTARRLFGALYEPLPAAWHPAAESLFALLVVWLLLYALYRRKVFITV